MNKFDISTTKGSENLYRVLKSRTKIDDSFRTAQFLVQRF